MVLRIGELLVRRGVLSASQRDEVLAEQKRSGRPFGDLAERMFGISPRDVEQAWAEQYASMVQPIDPRRSSSEPDALATVTSRQAWQFAMLPLRFSSGELIACTTQIHLARALRFAAWQVPTPVRFVLATPGHLGEALQAQYPVPGMRPEDLLSGTGIGGASVEGELDELGIED